MTTSIVTILACTAVMVSSAFALFYFEVSTADSTLQGAYYDISVSPAVDHSYLAPLAYEDKHDFVITAVGTASTGYCVITVDDAIYTTPAIPRGESLKVTVTAAAAAQITFAPVWGASPTVLALTEDAAVTGGDVMEICHSETPHAIYTVEPCARLSDIAAHYGISESDLCVYNALSDTSALSAGMTLKIPGVASDAQSYAVPYAVYTVEPTAVPEHIAGYYGVSLSDIYTFNGIDGITVGDQLRIPGIPADTAPYAVLHTTVEDVPADALPEISDHYGISEWAILAYNNIKELIEGFDLRIPGITADAEPYFVPAADPAEPTEPTTAASAPVTQPSDVVLPTPSTTAPEQTPLDGEPPALEPSESETPVADVAPAETPSTVVPPSDEAPVAPASEPQSSAPDPIASDGAEDSTAPTADESISTDVAEPTDPIIIE